MYVSQNLGWEGDQKKTLRHRLDMDTNNSQAAHFTNKDYLRETNLERGWKRCQ